ncbi:hypothetical protein CYMTET_50657 [Cymbomonas tetramitiformis]|uniref:Peptidase S54 rhomboid domain-containing protein n=1 Tax=Cymbomonas tetramitiformis TaxID=36881 RepID=A0AAE0EUJ2_9CHLO|nr:hypothetical protein CYMTET_50657 [Cymbomonas tetramitiformis]
MEIRDVIPSSASSNPLRPSQHLEPQDTRSRCEQATGVAEALGDVKCLQFLFALLQRLQAYIAIFLTSPLATKLLLCTCFGMYGYCTYHGWTTEYIDICSQPYTILHRLQVWRAFSSILFHPYLPPLLLNTIIFLYHGSELERAVGTIQYTWTLAVLAALCSLIHALIGYAIDSLLALSNGAISSNALQDSAVYALPENPWITSNKQEVYHCTMGLSGVALGVVLLEIRMHQNRPQSLFGLFTIPWPAYILGLLMGVTVLSPGVSFFGHLSGILAGGAYGYYMVRNAVEIPGRYLRCIESCWLISWMASDSTGHVFALQPAGEGLAAPVLPVHMTQSSFWARELANWAPLPASALAANRSLSNPNRPHNINSPPEFMHTPRV